MALSDSLPQINLGVQGGTQGVHTKLLWCSKREGVYTGPVVVPSLTTACLVANRWRELARQGSDAIWQRSLERRVTGLPCIVIDKL
ncbi:hypothetical protein TNCV_1039431 [Trichonephila clavipes]|uniref:Uncharacterized protein n=1 Tax=Trichonephila clavipes TaxID=2585209 RepID=A0A8X7BA81_TRICX|nr:hypothetical protein TNCV_1039431 [Trichonephila clavipes]